VQNRASLKVKFCFALLADFLANSLLFIEIRAKVKMQEFVAYGFQFILGYGKSVTLEFSFTFPHSF